jgi:hypothetical protein
VELEIRKTKIFPNEETEYEEGEFQNVPRYRSA